MSTIQPRKLCPGEFFAKVCNVMYITNSNICHLKMPENSQQDRKLAGIFHRAQDQNLVLYFSLLKGSYEKLSQTELIRISAPHLQAEKCCLIGWWKRGVGQWSLVFKEVSKSV